MLTRWIYSPQIAGCVVAWTQIRSRACAARHRRAPLEDLEVKLGAEPRYHHLTLIHYESVSLFSNINTMLDLLQSFFFPLFSPEEGSDSEFPGLLMSACLG